MTLINYEVSTVAKILIVGDEDNIRMLLRFNLEKAGYEVLEADNGQKALELVKSNKLDLILLDLMLPVIDGLEVCKQIKAHPETAHLPIIMLTAKSDEIDKVIGLELGADDYLSKPFSPRELLARIKAVLRRSIPVDTPRQNVQCKDLLINTGSYEAFLKGEKLELTPKEFELLLLFTSHPSQAFSREKLLEDIWGYEYFGDTRTVDVHIRHLRAKLSASLELAEAIETVRGVGYRFNLK